MRHRSFIACAIAAAAMLAAPNAKADEMVSIKLGYQIMQPSGTFAGSQGGVGGTIDLQNTLNFKDSKKPIGELALQLGDWRLSVGTLPMAFKGSGTTTLNVTFGGKTFNVPGQPVSSEVKADILDIGLAWYLINMDDLPSRFQLGPELSVKVTKARASLVATGQSAQVSGTAPIPTIGLRARVALADFIGVAGRIGYLKVGKNKFTDADVQIEFSPLPLVGIYAGYRQMQIKVDQSNVYLDTTFKGPYIGAFARF